MVSTIMQTTEQIEGNLTRIGVVAALRCRAPLDTMLEVGDALHAAPTPAVLISPGSRDPWSIVAELRQRYGRSMAVGAGLLRYAGSVPAAIDAGAQFILSAGFDEQIDNLCRMQGVLYVPGVRNAAQVQRALERKRRMMSFFPAARLGSTALAELAQTFPDARLFAVGGLDDRNLAHFARAGAQGAVVRGVLGAAARWRMRSMIMQIRHLRTAWEAAQ